MLEQAKYLIEKGFNIFPLYFRSKKPMGGSNGLHDATNDINRFKQLLNGNTKFNIGIRTGSGLAVIDVDPRNGGSETLIELSEKYEIPDTVISLSGGADKGRHYFFKTDEKITIKSKLKGIDIKCDGGYIVSPSSVHPDSGNKYQWMEGRTLEDLEIAELPIFFNPNKSVVISNNKLDFKTDENLPKDNYSPAEDGTRNDSLSSLAGELIREGDDYKKVMKTCLLWDRGNKSQLPYSEIETTVKSIFRTHALNHPVIEGLKKHIEEPGDDINLTDELLDVGGLIGRMCDEMNECAYLKQPILTFAGAITFFATVIGKFYKLRCDTRSNLYTVGIADSGAGKQGVINSIEIIANKSGLGHLIDAEDVTSGQAILKAVESSPNRAVYFPFDEVGDMIASVSGKQSANFEREKAKVFTTLYTSSAKTYKGKRFANGTRTELDQPLVCFYGTGNPHDFFEAVTPKMIKSGFFGRLLCFFPKNNDPDPNYDSERINPSNELIRDLSQWANAMIPHDPSKSDFEQVLSPDPVIIETSRDAQAVFRAYDNIFRSRKQKFKHRKSLDSLWVRPLVIAKKLSLIFTCSNSLTPRGIQNNKPCVSKETAERACEIALICFDRICVECERNVTASDFEAIQRDLMDCIRRHGQTGASKSNLCKELRKWTPTVRDQAVMVLIESGIIFKETQKTEANRKPIIKYFLAKI
jgi:hypothetical protein